MKKIKLLSFAFIFAISGFFSSDLKAQASNWEAGIRFGDNFSFDATVPLGISPRLHPSINFDRFGVATYFDWMFELTGANSVQGLKFYPGVGPEFWFEGRFDFGVGGDFGAEYSFKFPLTVGFDWRPAFIMTNGADFNSGNWGFTARFRFGEGTSFKKSN